MGKLTLLLLEREVCLYFLKTKTTSSYKVIYLKRNEIYDRVLLVSCIDLLKTKFTISLSELRGDHRFLLLQVNIFLFQLKFSSVESMEAFTESTEPGQLLLSAKESNNSTSRP